MVNTNELELTQLQQEILELLFVKVAKKLNQRQIANLLEVSQPAVMKSLPYLKDIELINMEQDKESRRWSIELNTDNHKVMQLKRVSNLRKLYLSGFVDFIEQELAGGTIILFGSYASGEDTRDSDIDLAVIGRKQKELDVKKFEDEFEREIRFNFYDSLSRLDKRFQKNLFNGIVLIRGLEI